MKKIHLYSDGASKGNPGDAGIGVVLSDEDGNVLREIAEYIGKQTNNVAEYSALIRGLQEAVDLGATQVAICTDSELLARQLTGVYRVKAPNLRPLFEKAVMILRTFERVTISHVMREFNKRADELANEGVRKGRGRLNSEGGPAMPPRRNRQRNLGF
jgi:ribonuclease HI